MMRGGGVGELPPIVERSSLNSGGNSHSIPPPELLEDHRVTAGRHRGNDRSVFAGRCDCSKLSLRASRAQRTVMRRIISSYVWRAFMILFTVLLLFGFSLQNLLVPPSGDIYFDIMYLVALVFFISDIVMRVNVQPHYFNIVSGRNSHGDDLSWGRCRFGSFVFWCDVVSTTTLLYGIRFVNRRSFYTATYDLVLDSFGVVDEGVSEVNRNPLSVDLDLLVIIAKTARVARFIRSSAVVKLSAYLNWYGWLNYVDPRWYYQKFQQRRKARKAAARSKSWQDFSIDVLAAVKAKQLAEMHRKQKQQQQQQQSSRRKGSSKIMSSIKGRLRTLGIFSSQYEERNEELRRQAAALKIQRAWRRTCEGADSFDAEKSMRHVAWDGRPKASNPLERIMHKRSIMRQHMAMNRVCFRGTMDENGDANSKANSNAVSAAFSTSSAFSHSNSDGDGGVTGSISAGENPKRNESQVGSAMRELTGQRVAIGIIFSLVISVLFTYTENDATRPSAMVFLHNQTANKNIAPNSNKPFGDLALEAARDSSIPDLFVYRYANGTTRGFPLSGESVHDLRDRETLNITITDEFGAITFGTFAYRNERKAEALVEVIATLFILFVWLIGVAAFSGPVMTLIVIPIERMVQLLDMLMLDPLGYENSARYMIFKSRENDITTKTGWTKDLLRGMETSFLMSTILRIGRLMKVGFGSAGVDIIRGNLEGGGGSSNRNMIALNSKGTTVSCIFLFCDIRQFTDATESLQEEVFVFTNRIAAVVHSICNSYNGAANKNVGDAFLLSWLLDDVDCSANSTSGSAPRMRFHGGSGNAITRDNFSAINAQADKALYSVVKILMALHHDDFYIKTMTEHARTALLAKLSKRKGPVVQMGFGLHAGKAVQGAIGSQRKIDATYVSESVERAEFLESSTKKYGVKMLMSDSFHRLLHPHTRSRCRKVDQIIIRSDDDDDDDVAEIDRGDIMELFTFDMDIDALWRPHPKKRQDQQSQDAADNGSDNDSKELRAMGSSRGLLKSRRRSISNKNKLDTMGSSHEVLKANATDATTTGAGAAVDSNTDSEEMILPSPPELVLPTSPSLYSLAVWQSDEIRRMRDLYTDGVFFAKFNTGLQAFYSRDWEAAKVCFQAILNKFEDGPSRYFLKQIEQHRCIPPQDFKEYGTA